jgi:hypothetical protein
MTDTLKPEQDLQAGARAAFELHFQRTSGVTGPLVRTGSTYSNGFAQHAWLDFQAGMAYAQRATAVTLPSDQGIIDCFTKAGVWLGVNKAEVARNVQAVKYALEQFEAPAPAEADPARADERVPSIGHPTTYRELATISSLALWNRWRPTDRSLDARAAFIAARAIPFAATAEVVRNAARYREVRERTYRYGVGHPTPGQLDAMVDAGIAARAESQVPGARE